MKRFISYLFVLIMLNITGFTQEVNSCYHEINSDEFNLLLQTKNTLLVDVRLFKDYREERIAGAMIATEKLALKELLNNIEKEIIILVYCEKGKRSKKASEYICSELNFQNVYSLQYGLEEWIKKGYLTDKKALQKEMN